MKKEIIIGISLSVLMLSCATEVQEDAAVENIVTEEIVDADKTGEESTEVAYMGITKGDYTLYGHTDFDPTKSTSIDAMITEFEVAGTFNDAVDITINEVCQNAGCWINFQTPDSDETIMVFFRDHFTIPIDASLGKEAILYGQLISDTLTVDFQKHLLDDATANGEEVSQAEYDAILEDKIDVSFDCESIMIKN